MVSKSPSDWTQPKRGVKEEGQEGRNLEIRIESNFRKSNLGLSRDGVNSQHILMSLEQHRFQHKISQNDTAYRERLNGACMLSLRRQGDKYSEYFISNVLK